VVGLKLSDLNNNDSRSDMAEEKFVCTACGHIGPSKTVTKGHFALEVVLWLCFLVPGIIYSLWRLASRTEACPICGNGNILPAAAPMAQKFIKDNFPEQLAACQPEPIRPPSQAAKSAGRTLGKWVGKFLK
jgi:predicted RNA-binding Zn-ribbon protein involved in translation (DUF1610 family)